MRAGKHLTWCLGVVNTQEIVTNVMCKNKGTFSALSGKGESFYIGILAKSLTFRALSVPLGQPSTILGSQIRLKCSQSVLFLEAYRRSPDTRGTEESKNSAQFWCPGGKVGGG